MNNEKTWGDKKRFAFREIKARINYIIVFAVSFIILVFFPMIGSEADANFKLPQTIGGWIIWITTKLIVSGMSVIIFRAFIEQGKLNIREDERYKEGARILGMFKEENYVPISPKAWERKQYLSKGITLFLGALASTIALTNAFLTYDWMSLISYIITIVFSIVFGLLQMADTEDYYTHMFVDYAYKVQKEAELKKIEQEKIKAMEEQKNAEILANLDEEANNGNNN